MLGFLPKNHVVEALRKGILGLGKDTQSRLLAPKTAFMPCFSTQNYGVF
jgi:hypothetical protein